MLGTPVLVLSDLNNARYAPVIVMLIATVTGASDVHKDQGLMDLRMFLVASGQMGQIIFAWRMTTFVSSPILFQ